VKFSDIIITNFRSYYGENKFEFAEKEKQPVTMVVGNNGGGKSSLMRAIQWCLYGEDIKDIKHNESRDPVCEVAINFSHEGQQYRAHRRLTNGQDSSLRLLKIAEDKREMESIGEPQLTINGFLPIELKSWFFYEAEGSGSKSVTSLDLLAGNKNSKEALRKIQGFTKIDQLIEDLDKIHKDKERQRIKQGENKEAKIFQEKIDSLEIKLEPILKMKAGADDDIERYDEKFEKLQEDYRNTPQTAPLQEEIDRLNPHIITAKKRLGEKEKKQKSFLAEHLPIFLIKQLITKNKTPKQHKEGVQLIRSPDNTDLYDEITDNGKCICGTPVKPDSKEDKSIKKFLLDKSKDKEINIFNSRARGVEAVMSSIDLQAEKFENERIDIKEEIESIETSIKNNNGRVDELNKEIAKIGNTEAKIKKITETIHKLEPQIKAASVTSAKASNQISEIREEIASLEKERDMADDKKAMTDTLSDFINRVSKIKAYAEKKQKQDEEIALRTLMIDLNQAIKKTSFANIECRINRDTYGVTIFDKTTQKEKPALNDGDKELIKTCLVACVVGQASKKSQAKYKYLAKATSAPIIIDAPFTKMDVDYISGCVSVLLEKTEQLILLSLPADYLKYEDKVFSKLGKKYAVVRADRGSRDTEEISEYKLFKEKIDLVTFDNVDDNDAEAVTQSKIVEVKGK
jgi:DNA sulfur modification protein DndD